MKRLFFLLTTLMCVLILSACGITAPSTPEASTPVPVVITDGLQRDVQLSQPAQKIISLAPSNTEILYAIGAGSQVIGRDEFSNYPEEAKALPGVGGSMGNYSLEMIASLKPDLVLAAEINTPEQVKALEDLGITVFWLGNPTDMEGMYANLLTVGKLAGRTTEAEELVAALRQRVDAVVSKVGTPAEPVVVFYELDGSEPSKPWTAGSGTFLDQLLSMAGGKNAASDIQSPWAQISLEDLVVKNPDIILLGDANYGVTPQQVAERVGWGALQAVKDGRVFPYNDDLVSRPGPRLVDGLEELARILHPELFK